MWLHYASGKQFYSKFCSENNCLIVFNEMDGDVFKSNKLLTDFAQLYAVANFALVAIYAATRKLHKSAI